MRRIGLLVVLLLSCADDVEPGRIACGDQGGSCDRETEVCVIGGPDRCSSCLPKPAACDEASTCGCLPPASDPGFGERRCVDAGVCEEVDGGLVLTCSEIAWSCG